MASKVETYQERKPNEVIRRIRRIPFKRESSRRVSCKDLGNGDCEGWLWKKAEKPGLVSKDWKKFWFTLKEKNLYYYKHRDDGMAQGIFKMPAFIVSPTSEKDSSRKFAFKACHPKYGTYLFASERKEDMVKWMNMLQVACLLDVNPKQLSTITSVSDDYSGSESDEECSTVSVSSPQVSSSQPEVSPSIESSDTVSELSFSELARSSRASGLIELTIRPSIKETLQRSIKAKSNEAIRRRHLAALQRTLKDKETQLNILIEFLSNSSPVTSEALKSLQSISRVAEILNVDNDEETETTTDTSSKSCVAEI